MSVSLRRSTPSKTHKSEPARREGPKVSVAVGSLYVGVGVL